MAAVLVVGCRDAFACRNERPLFVLVHASFFRPVADSSRVSTAVVTLLATWYWDPVGLYVRGTASSQESFRLVGGSCSFHLGSFILGYSRRNQLATLSHKADCLPVGIA